MKKTGYSLVATAILGTLLVSGINLATAHADELAPRQLVETTVEKVRKAVTETKQSGEALDKQLEEIIYPVFDFEEMARSTIASEWSKIDEGKRKEFVTLFSDLLARTYLKKIKENIVDSSLVIKNDSTESEKAVIKTVSKGKQDQIAVDYRFHKRDGKWKVNDVAVENVSLIATYRTQFGEILHKGGIDDLVAKLRNKEKMGKG